MHVVLSLGTGKMPVQPIKAIDVYRPEGLFDLAKVAFGARELAEVMIDQVCDLLKSLSLAQGCMNNGPTDHADF